MSGVSVMDGKYTFSVPEDDYRVHVLRYGEPWVVIEAGCNAVAAMFRELDKSRLERDAAIRERDECRALLQRWADTGYGRNVPSLAEETRAALSTEGGE